MSIIELDYKPMESLPPLGSEPRFPDYPRSDRSNRGLEGWIIEDADLALSSFTDETLNVLQAETSVSGIETDFDRNTSEKAKRPYRVDLKRSSTSMFGVLMQSEVSPKNLSALLGLSISTVSQAKQIGVPLLGKITKQQFLEQIGERTGISEDALEHLMQFSVRQAAVFIATHRFDVNVDRTAETRTSSINFAITTSEGTTFLSEKAVRFFLDLDDESRTHFLTAPPEQKKAFESWLDALPDNT